MTAEIIQFPRRNVGVVSSRCATLVTRYGVDQPCSGLLTYQDGAWQHADACPDCIHTPQPCPDRIGHHVCALPQPAECLHGGCLQPVDIGVVCVIGTDGECCGCCHGDDDIDGRLLWPR